jgi:hypothetical protein
MTRADKLAQLRSVTDPQFAIAHALGQTLKSVQTLKGEKGDSPVKYVDYWTPDELNQIIAYLESRIRVPQDGAPGADGQGIKGDRGEAGATPVRGVHYWTGEDQRQIITSVRAQIKDGVSPKVEDVTALVLKEMSKRTISYKDIMDAPDLTDLPQLIEFLKRGGFRGGGSTSTSGTSTYYNDTVNGVINGTNKIFTVAHTIQSPIFLSLANSSYQSLIDYTTSGFTITMAVAPDASIAGQPFWLSHT